MAAARTAFEQRFTGTTTTRRNLLGRGEEIPGPAVSGERGRPASVRAVSGQRGRPASEKGLYVTYDLAALHDLAQLRIHGVELGEPPVIARSNLSGIGRSGTGTLKVDGKVVASQKMERTLPLILQWDENFDIGADTGTPVDDKDYQVPFRFTGKLEKLTLKIDRPRLSPEDEKRLLQESRRNNRASE